MESNVLDKIAARAHLKETTAVSEWRALVFKVVGGKELTGPEIDHLDDLGAILGHEDVPEKFRSDVELVQEIQQRQAKFKNATAEAEELHKSAENTRKEIERLTGEVIPELRQKQMNDYWRGEGLSQEWVKLNNDLKARPDLFPPEPAAVKKK